MQKLRIIFMGSPDFAVPALRALAAAGHDVRAAYTQPPRPGGRRGKELTPTAVHRAAEELGIAVRYPVSLKGADVQAEFAALNADVAVVAAYGLILPPAVLEAPRLGCLNIHGSLLPRWRGAAPVQRAILAGDAETGVGIMQMAAGLDTGPVLAEARTTIAGKNTPQLTDELAQMGATLMVQVLADLAAFPAASQPEQGVTYASKIAKAETHLNFTHSAEQVERQVRALWPSAWFELDGERYRVLAVEIGGTNGPAGTTTDDSLTIACATGAVRPTLVQRAGRPAMPVADLLRGRAIPAGTPLS
jgi:methionyl-tRNA formyltransferase